MLFAITPTSYLKDTKRPMPAINLKKTIVLVAAVLLVALRGQTTLTTTTTISSYCKLPLNITSSLLTSEATLTISTTSSTVYTCTITNSSSSTILKVINFSPDTHTLTISVAFATNTTLTLDSLLTIESGHQPQWFTGIISKKITSGYMLPFNLFSQSKPRVIATQLQTPLTPATYNLAPYMSTYWTQIQSQQLLIPFLPFLSECSVQNSHFMLNSLLEPDSCVPHNDGIRCDDQMFNFQCIIEELEVSNVNSEFWFNRQAGVIFYLFPEPLSPDILRGYASSPSELTTITAEHHSKLIPVVYTRDSSSRTRINHLQVSFKVGLDPTSHPKILAASMHGSLRDGIDSPYMQVETEVAYLNVMEKLSMYYYPKHWYFLAGGALSLLMLVLLWKCQRCCIGRVSFDYKLKYLLAPALKGLCYAFLTAGFYFVFIYVLINFTKFGGVDPLYGSTVLEGDELLMNNIGRTGLGIAFAGFYLLMKSISQTSNVNEPQDLRRRLEGEQDLGETEEKVVQSINFLRMNLFSQKTRVLMGMLLGVGYSLFLFFNFMGMESWLIAVVQILVMPWMEMVMSMPMRLYLLKQLLYMCGFFLSLNLGVSFYLFKAQNLWVFLGLYLCRLVHMLALIFLDEIILTWLCRKVSQNKDDNLIAKFLYKISSKFIDTLLAESQYERSLYYTTIIGQQVLNILLFPICCGLMLLTQDTHLIWNSLYVTTSWVSYPLIVIICLIPVELYALVVVLQLLKRKAGIRIQEILRFNSYKLKKKKLVWMNDEFVLSKHLSFLYKQLEKFGFSSQLYFTITLLGMALYIMYLGIITMINSQYLPFQDPALAPLLFTTVSLGWFFSLIANYLAVKLKLYAKNEEKIIVQSLSKTAKYLRHDHTELHLELHAVKDYFLVFNKEWIVANLNNIFTKEELQANNSEIINKYKKYKSQFKQHQIDEKRRKKKSEQRNTGPPQPANPAHHQLPLQRRQFESTAKPLVYYWYYLARQHLHLRRIVLPVQKEKMKEVCEYCNMEVELESIQKRQFEELVAEFRVLNVGRLFDEAAFLEFYRINQEYITICVECREKNLHMENRIQKSSREGKLVLAWLMAARSRLLHGRTKPQTASLNKHEQAE